MNIPDYAAEYNLPSLKKGDTFTEKAFVVTSTHGNLEKVEIIFGPSIKFTSEGDAAELTITDAATGSWKINEQVISWPESIYEYVATFTFADETIRSYMFGTFEIL